MESQRVVEAVAELGSKCYREREELRLENERLRAALNAARDALVGWMNLPLESDQAWIDQERDDLALMDKVRIALGMKPWLEACGIELRPNVI